MIQITATYTSDTGALFTQTSKPITREDTSFDRLSDIIAGALYGIESGPVRLIALYTDTLLAATEPALLTLTEDDGDALDVFISQLALALEEF